jgi:hypothetical protein
LLGWADSGRLDQRDNISTDDTREIAVVQLTKRSEGFTTEDQLAGRFFHFDTIAQRS